MAIFHSYVSLPEGISHILGDAKPPISSTPFSTEWFKEKATQEMVGYGGFTRDFFWVSCLRELRYPHHCNPNPKELCGYVQNKNIYYPLVILEKHNFL